ncbi:hypothetical protein HK097_010841 [Rhizophlyctis rosea]|uniref:Uncharacterized protein n=1 Tax=Rhizophlyctis rosea TaxID=64517 RepID=A0AAD5SP51_9FUNG|nr:hypothetical protein HK097_010841 [Rhizophlyctis rosea]
MAPSLKFWKSKKDKEKKEKIKAAKVALIVQQSERVNAATGIPDRIGSAKAALKAQAEYINATAPDSQPLTIETVAPSLRSKSAGIGRNSQPMGLAATNTASTGLPTQKSQNALTSPSPIEATDPVAVSVPTLQSQHVVTPPQSQYNATAPPPQKDEFEKQRKAYGLPEGVTGFVVTDAGYIVTYSAKEWAAVLELQKDKRSFAMGANHHLDTHLRKAVHSTNKSTPTSYTFKPHSGTSITFQPDDTCLLPALSFEAERAQHGLPPGVTSFIILGDKSVVGTLETKDCDGALITRVCDSKFDWKQELGRLNSAIMSDDDIVDGVETAKSRMSVSVEKPVAATKAPEPTPKANATSNPAPVKTRTSGPSAVFNSISKHATSVLKASPPTSASKPDPKPPLPNTKVSLTDAGLVPKSRPSTFTNRDGITYLSPSLFERERIAREIGPEFIAFVDLDEEVDGCKYFGVLNLEEWSQLRAMQQNGRKETLGKTYFLHQPCQNMSGVRVLPAGRFEQERLKHNIPDGVIAFVLRNGKDALLCYTPDEFATLRDAQLKGWENEHTEGTDWSGRTFFFDEFGEYPSEHPDHPHLYNVFEYVQTNPESVYGKPLSDSEGRDLRAWDRPEGALLSPSDFRTACETHHIPVVGIIGFIIQHGPEHDVHMLIAFPDQRDSVIRERQKGNTLAMGRMFSLASEDNSTAGPAEYHLLSLDAAVPLAGSGDFPNLPTYPYPTSDST